MRIEQIIVTGLPTHQMTVALQKALQLFDYSPPTNSLAKSQYCSFTIPPDADGVDRYKERVEFCKYLEEHCSRLSFVWLECVVDELNRKGKDEDRIIFSNNWEMDY